jgi:hypothetical protein
VETQEARSRRVMVPVVAVSQRMGDRFTPWHHDVPTVEDRQARYWLLLEIRSSADDRETLKPTGHATPVPPSPQYPPGFLARYCWW